MATDEHICLSCGHSFPVVRLGADVESVRCPRCGSFHVLANPWLLGTSSADLTEEDYYAVISQV